MIDGLELKLASVDDLDTISEAGDKLFDNKIKTNRAIEFLNDVRHHLVLAVYNNQLVGMASGFHYVHPDKEPSLFINEVGVMDEYQNQGIGRRLVRFLCEHGRTLGCTEAWVLTDKSNIVARKTYLAAGGVEERKPSVLFEFVLNK